MEIEIFHVWNFSDETSLLIPALLKDYSWRKQQRTDLIILEIFKHKSASKIF